MKTIINSISNSVLGPRMLNNKIVKPIKAGFLGFFTILMIIFLFNLISLITGTKEKIGVDSVDFLLAGTGFVLQVTGTFVKSYIR